MDGKSRKLESAKGVVNTTIAAAGPRALCGPISMTLKSGNSPVLTAKVCWEEAHRVEPVARRPIIKCGTTGCTGSCPTSALGHGFQLGRSQTQAGLWEDQLGLSEFSAS